MQIIRGGWIGDGEGEGDGEREGKKNPPRPQTKNKIGNNISEGIKVLQKRRQDW